mgnify:FL=1
MTHERGKLEAIEGMVPELIEPGDGCRFASRCKNKKSICDMANPQLLALSDTDKSQKVSCFLYHPEDSGKQVKA